MERVAIAATCELKPGRYPDKTPLDLYAWLLREAIAQWNLRPGDIDGLFCTPGGIALGEIDITVHEKLTDRLGVKLRVSEAIYAGGASFNIMVHRAYALIRAGLASSILCMGTGKFRKVGAGGAEIQAKLASDPSFEFPYGTYIVPNYALAASQYMAETGTPREALAHVAVAARQWALRNPAAVMHTKGPVSVADVLASRPISTPFNLLDCSLPCEGGGAVLVAREDIARRIARCPAWILGVSELHATGTISQHETLAHSGARETGAEVFAMSRMTPRDIDVIQAYDAFSFCPLMVLDDLGFGRDEGGAAGLAMSGAFEPGGRLPLNTFGGLLSYGHTGEAAGMSLLVEGARQVMQEAGPTQTKASTALVHCYGGMFSEHSTLILSREI
ncbi:thiolase family protein [Caballeronia sp. AZ7_KS35]|uniref:thiolase family protein n=1 Tax=Caballeronia sp. AZ7_KS35 TaxID=2921762 RepID=UPI0020283E1F|nr:thiolase family protein [Caballeronia sp. AZ7_KS35]